MSKITFKDIRQQAMQKVYLEGKLTGRIYRTLEDKFKYVTRSGHIGVEFDSLAECQKSLMG